MIHWRYLVLIQLVIVYSVLSQGSFERDLSVIGLQKENNNKVSRKVLNFTEIANKYGYKTETHTVITTDNYILTIFRVLKRKHCRKVNEDVPPVLFQHSVLLSADSFIILGPDDGLGFNMADACFDVWFANNRGTKYGLRHRTLNYTRDKAFWDFSFHEHGLYDTSAAIDHVLKETGFQKLNIITFSEGATQLFVLTSETKEYDDKINVAICLGPIAYLYNIGISLTKSVGKLFPGLQRANGVLGLRNLFARSNVLETSLILSACKKMRIKECDLILFTVVGYNKGSINERQLQDISLSFPSGVSVKNIFHLGQLINVDDFRQYDYLDDALNKRVYGDAIPPSYKLSNINIPLVFIVSENDQIANPSDVNKLTTRLNKLPEVITIGNKSWTHLDFMFNRNICELLSPRVYNLLLKYK